MLSKDAFKVICFLEVTIFNNILLKISLKNRFSLWGPGMWGALAPAPLTASLKKITKTSVLFLIFIGGGKKIEAKEIQNRFALSSSLTLKTNHYSWGSQSHSSGVSFALAPSFAITKKSSVGVSVSTFKKIDQYENWQWSRDAMVFVNYDWGNLTKTIRTSTSVENYFPTTSYSRKYSLLNYAIAWSQSVQWRASSWASLVYVLSLQKNFHQYKTSFDQSSNEEWRNSHVLSASMGLSKKIKLNLSFSRSFAWTYSGRQNDYLSIGQSLSYNFQKKLNLKIGHSRGGDFFKADGKTQNFDFYDSEKSSFYLAFSINV